MAFDDMPNKRLKRLKEVLMVKYLGKSIYKIFTVRPLPIRANIF